MKITKLKKYKFKSTFNLFRAKANLKKNESNDILKLTKSILIKKTTNNNYVEDYINNNLSNTISKQFETIDPLTDHQKSSKKPISSNHNLNYISNRNINDMSNSNLKRAKDTNISLNDNSFLLLNLKDSINKKLNLRHTFFHKIKNMEEQKNKNNQLSESPKNKIYEKKKYIFDKIKKRIKNFKKEEEKLYSFNNPNDISYNKVNQNFDSLFIDFFYKWYKNNISSNGIKSIINNKYSDLIYDENEIFHYDFSEFIYNKIYEYKNEKMQNIQDKKQCVFYDKNNKEIKLTLSGMKLNFIPINKKFSNISYNLPFTFSLLFYYKGIKFFRSVLLSIIKFTNKDFDDIAINLDEVNSLLNKKIVENDSFKRKLNRVATQNISRRKNKSISAKKKKLGEIFIKKSNIVNNNSSFMSNNYNNNQSKVKFEIPFKGNYIDNSKKQVIRTHSSLQRNYESESIFYNSYFFIWETPKISYKIILQMPKITFEYHDIPKKIITFCHEKIMLFLLKNNFVNWDFYLMNFLFSIKAFRNIILNYISYSPIIDNICNIRSKFKKDYSNKLLFDKEKNKNLKNIAAISKNEYHYTLIEKNNNIYLELNSINSFFQLFNQKNEVYYFFYTNNSRINSIILFYSYKILVEYEKLNPFNSWEFILNFKQMKFLNEIKNYESLQTFIPKIILGNFENGKLSLDFTVFDDFDPKIINYDKKEVINPYKIEKKNINLWRSFRKPKNDVTLKIQNPSIKIEKYICDNTKSNNINIGNDYYVRELDRDILKKIDNKGMEFWSKIIIDFIEDQHLIDNLSVNDSPIIQKISTKKRTKKRSSTVIFPTNKEEKVKSILFLNNYANN